MADRIQFSEKYFPKHIWIMDTIHDIRAYSEKHLGFVPRAVLDGIFRQFSNKNERLIETVMFLMVHNTEEDNYDAVAILGKTDRKKNVRVSMKKIMEGLDEEDVLFNLKLNEVRMLHDPKWKGTRQTPIELSADTYKEILAELSRVERKSQFEDYVLNQGGKESGVFEVFVEEGDKTFNVDKATKQMEELGVEAALKGLVKSDLRKLDVDSDTNKHTIELTKNGKIPAAKRKKLVALYGEANILDLEARIAKRLKQ